VCFMRRGSQPIELSLEVRDFLYNNAPLMDCAFNMG
jgi:hypothetical protein